jgi:hypothetical protein
VLSNEWFSLFYFFSSSRVWYFEIIFVHDYFSNKIKANWIVDFYLINSKFILLINSLTLHAQSLIHLMMNNRKKFVIIIIIIYVCQYNIMQIYSRIALTENLYGIILNKSKLFSDIGQRNLLLDIILCQTYKCNVINRIKWLVDSQANLLSWIPMWKADHCRKSLMYNVTNWYSFIIVGILVLLLYQI